MRASAATAAPSVDVFRAVADPTRRAILDRLRAAELSVNDLAGPFDMSQPAISQHLRVLLDAGLVSERRAGRERLYQLHPERLQEVRDWLRKYERFWRARLVALDSYLENAP